MQNVTTGIFDVRQQYYRWAYSVLVLLFFMVILGDVDASQRASLGAKVGETLLKLNNCTAQKCDQENLNRVVVGDLDPKGALYQGGLRTGDVILKAYSNVSDDYKTIKSIADLAAIINNHSIGDKLFVGYQIPIDGQNTSQHWQRLKYTQITLGPPPNINSLVEQKRPLTIDVLLDMERRSFNTEYLIQSRLNGTKHYKHSIQEYDDTYLNELKVVNKKRSASQTSMLHNNISKECLKHGKWPAIPVLTFPSDYLASGELNPQQLQLVTGRTLSGRIVGNGANAAKSVANGRLFFEEVLKMLNRSRDAFWGEYDKGIYNEKLKNEYAFWLHEGKKYNIGGRSPRNAVDVFMNMASASTRGKFSYHIEPAIDRDTYQYLTNSKCSPLKSRYPAESDATLQLIKQYDKTSSAVMYRHGTLREYLEKNVTYENLGDFDFSTNYDLSEFSGVANCVSWAKTKGENHQPCFDGSLLNVKLTSEKEFIVPHSLYRKEIIDSYMQRIIDDRINANSDLGPSCKSKNTKIIKYLFYANPDLEVANEFKPRCDIKDVANFVISDEFYFEISDLLKLVQQRNPGEIVNSFAFWNRFPKFKSGRYLEYWKAHWKGAKFKE